MASKAFPLFSLFTLFIITLSLLFHSILADANHKNQSSPFESIKLLQGCRKGDEVKGIQDLKKYLEMFGYLNYNNSIKKMHADADDFDELLESAIKTYQLNFHLKSTGVLDAKTIAKMATSRCGVADIVNGKTSMRSGKKRHHSHHGSTHFHTVYHYEFIKGNRWPDSKFNLTYAFLPGTRTDAATPVARAFDAWAANTHFKFSQTQDTSIADITISFRSWDHGDGSPFDGPGGIIAHAFPPTNGVFHYDADERWAVGAREGELDLETVALHEIGHLLGLGHSSLEAAIMYPYFPFGATKGLNQDDIEGIRALYNAPFHV